MSRPRLAALVALAATLVAAGCGGGGSGGGGASGGSAGYFDQVTKIGEGLATKMESLQSKASSEATEQAALSDMGQLAALFASTARDLDGLSPPSNVSSLQSKAVARLREGASTLHADVSKGALERATTDYSKLGNAATSAILDISIKGP